MIHKEQQAAGTLQTELNRTPIEMPQAAKWMMTSPEGRKFQIMLALPADEPPSSGYPVIYVLDANSVFGTAVEAVRMQSRRPDKTGVVPAIVVGIGYETDSPLDPSRFYDFTPTPAPFRTRSDGSPLPPQGGADAFLDFVEQEVKPLIAAEYPVDHHRQTLFGHSLGGLFVLHTMFTRPESFQCYVSGSPSVHWCQELLATEEAVFAAGSGWKDSVQLLVGFGEEEQSHVSGNCGNSQALVGRLQASGVNAKFKLFDDETHVSLLPVLISATLRLALRPQGDGEHE